MENRLKGKTALITGASRGIGKTVATTLAAEGMNLVLHATTTEGLRETAEECLRSGAKVSLLACDIADTNAVRNLADEASKAFGSLHVLINNAGYAIRGRHDEIDLKDWDSMLDINLRGLMHLTRHTLPHMERQPWGAVINISSIMGKMTVAGHAGYCATKHGVSGFTSALFEDVRENNIKVCSICPGFVATDMVTGRSGVNTEKMIQPQDIADTVLFVLNFPDSGCPTEIIIRPQKSPYT